MFLCYSRDLRNNELMTSKYIKVGTFKILGDQVKNGHQRIKNKYILSIFFFFMTIIP